MMTCPLAGEERIMSIESLVRHLSAVGDPRCQGKIEHRLIDILVIAVCAVIACAESWDDVALYGRSKLAWLRTFLELPNGIPSHDTFRRVFMLIDPDAFERGFAAWVGSLVDSFEREVVAIDGKTLRRSFDRSRERSPLHLVSAWASEQGLVLGQRRVHEVSNEITAIPELLDQLALENQQVVGPARQDLLGDCSLAAHGVQRHDAVLQCELVQQFRDGCDLIGRLMNTTLAQHEALLARPGTHQVQGGSLPPAIERAPERLAINGDHFTRKAVYERADPGREPALESIGIDEHEHTPEGIVRGNAVWRACRKLFPTDGRAARERGTA